MRHPPVNVVVGLAVPSGVFAAVSTWVAAVQFTNSVTTGALIISAAAGLATVIGVIYGVRWKVAYAVEVKAREGEARLNETLEDRIRTVAHERDELVAKLDEINRTLDAARKTIARLEPLNDMARVLEMVTSSFEQLVSRQETMHIENKLKVDQQTEILLGRIDGRAAEPRL